MAATRSSGVGDVYAGQYFTGTAAQSAFVATGYGALVGFSFAELANSTASFRLHDGVATQGNNCLTSLVTLSGLQSGSDWYGPQGVAVATGVYVEVVAGRVEVVVAGN